MIIRPESVQVSHPTNGDELWIRLDNKTVLAIPVDMAKALMRDLALFVRVDAARSHAGGSR
ncbi:hypothetical protein ACWCQL_01415 [Streptomyces sp. NPDC002073]